MGTSVFRVGAEDVVVEVGMPRRLHGEDESVTNFLRRERARAGFARIVVDIGSGAPGEFPSRSSSPSAFKSLACVWGINNLLLLRIREPAFGRLAFPAHHATLATIRRPP